MQQKEKEHFSYSNLSKRQKNYRSCCTCTHTHIFFHHRALFQKKKRQYISEKVLFCTVKIYRETNGNNIEKERKNIMCVCVSIPKCVCPSDMERGKPVGHGTFFRIANACVCVMHIFIFCLKQKKHQRYDTLHLCKLLLRHDSCMCVCVYATHIMDQRENVIIININKTEHRQTFSTSLSGVFFFLYFIKNFSVSFFFGAEIESHIYIYNQRVIVREKTHKKQNLLPKYRHVSCVVRCIHKGCTSSSFFVFRRDDDDA